jgi:hypothetical protein
MLTVLVLSLAFKEPPETAPMPQQPLVAAAPVRLAGLYTPNDCVIAALADVKTLPPDVAKYTRYFDARNLTIRPEQFGIVSYQVNSLSHYPTIVKPVQVKPWLWRINLNDYAMTSEVWEKFDLFDSYYHIPVAEVAAPIKLPDPEPVKSVTINGAVQPQAKPAAKEPEHPPKVYAKPGFGLDVTAITELSEITKTGVPIMRGDDYVFLTGIQVNRAGVGYLDQHGFKSLDDVKKLARLDEKGSDELFRTRAGFMGKSGVALNNRQVYRLVATSGPWWETHDSKSSVKQSNAINNLNRDFKHNAEEIVFRLPNDLPGYYACDDKGVQAESVPDFIAADQRASGNDRRIHVGYSCITCHEKNGLKDMTDFARSYFQSDPKVSLKILEADQFKAQLLKSSLGKSLIEPFERDAEDYGKAIQEASGIDPKNFSAEYEKFWAAYLNEYVTLEKAAFECGVTPEILKKALLEYAAVKGVTNPVLSSYLHEKVLPVRREHFSEHFQLLMLILSGAKP